MTAPTTRRRGAVLTQAIRQAVLDDLADGGYGSVTYEGVSRRARASKPVLYRRYPTRAHMVADALLGDLRTRRMEPQKPTGPLRADLHSLFSLVVAPSRMVGARVLRALMGEADDELASLIINGDQRPAIDMLLSIVDHARGRGELGPSPIPRPALLAPVGLLRTQVLEEDMPPGYLDEVIDTVAIPLYRLWSHNQAEQ
ncbi:MAG: TetR-like C-terminal domain-containing protein [Propionicimonas sp.]|nr:TetR-like C-terminal domain-containing protein [Propionicimonas sp.]